MEQAVLRFAELNAPGIHGAKLVANPGLLCHFSDFSRLRRWSRLD